MILWMESMILWMDHRISLVNNHHKEGRHGSERRQTFTP
jgi:hypothetical protein